MTKVKRDGVYLYSRYRGRFDVYQGDVRPSSYNHGKGNAQFTYIRNGKEARLQCDPAPGVVHHSVLWLPERDDNFAREIFIKHEEDAIQELRDKIEHHKWNIKQIKESADRDAK
jgi:hypothetical protein